MRVAVWRSGCMTSRAVADTTLPVPDRRSSETKRDRRKNSRSGRRKSDPHTNWRRIAWVFAVYAAYLSIRSLPSTVKSFFKRTTTPAN